MRLTISGRAMGAAVVAGALAVGGIAWAAIPDPDGVIHGCYNPTAAAGPNSTPLSIVDAPRATCGKNQKEITWGQTGPRGLPGQDGVSVTSASLAAGDANCPTGGSKFTAAAGSETYACNGQKGDKGDPGDAGPAGPSNAYTNYGDTRAIAEGTTQTVASVTLPAGLYTLSATMYVLRTSGDHTHAFCSFVSFGTLNARGGLAALEGVNSMVLPLIGDVTTTAAATAVFLRCQAIDGPIQVTGQLIGTRVGAITPSE